MMKFLKKLHKWLSLLIGLQVLAWVLSGLVISLLDPEKVTGQKWMNTAPDTPEALPAGVVLEPDELGSEHLRGALGINLVNRGGKPGRHRWISSDYQQSRRRGTGAEGFRR